MPINKQQQINDIMTKGLMENISKKSVSQSTTRILVNSRRLFAPVSTVDFEVGLSL